jgi:GNAT superfamily N-acetyltransferase
LKISLHPWPEVPVDEVAALTYAVKKDGMRIQGPEAIRTITNWLQDEFAGQQRVAVLARNQGELVGWLFLVVHAHADARRSLVEANPWFLGGQPLVAPGCDPRAIGALLLARASRWAEEEGMGRIEVAVPHTGNAEQDSETGKWYEAQGFPPKLTYVDMACSLSEQELAPASPPPGIKIALLAEADEEALYACYTAAFAAGDALFFFDQDERERRAFFGGLGLDEAREEPASLTLRHQERLVGFTYVLSYGEGNRHISCMCVHPDWQGQDLGKLMLRRVMHRVAAGGQESITLGTETGMRAYHLYQNHGFQVTGGSTVYAWRRPPP